METTTVHVLQTTRDWLDIVVVVSTILTGIGIASFAFVSLWLQVTRHLKDSEPDLRFGDTPSDVQLLGGPDLNFGIWFNIDNRSAHRATNLSWESLTLSGPPGNPAPKFRPWETPNEPWPLEGEYLALPSPLPGSSRRVRVVFRTGRARIDGPYFLNIILGYSAPRGVFLRLIRLGNRRFRRTAIYSWQMANGQLIAASPRWEHD